MAKSSAKKATKVSKPVRPAVRPAHAAVARKHETARAAVRSASARSKLERVKVPLSTRRETGSEGRYVYCIVRSEEPLSFGPLGLGPDPTDVHTVHYQDIAAVVSNTPMVVQDPTR